MCLDDDTGRRRWLAPISDEFFACRSKIRVCLNDHLAADLNAQVVDMHGLVPSFQILMPGKGGAVFCWQPRFWLRVYGHRKTQSRANHPWVRRIMALSPGCMRISEASGHPSGVPRFFAVCIAMPL